MKVRNINEVIETKHFGPCAIDPAVNAQSRANLTEGDVEAQTTELKSRRLRGSRPGNLGAIPICHGIPPPTGHSQVRFDGICHWGRTNTDAMAVSRTWWLIGSQPPCVNSKLDVSLRVRMPAGWPAQYYEIDQASVEQTTGDLGRESIRSGIA